MSDRAAEAPERTWGVGSTEGSEPHGDAPCWDHACQCCTGWTRKVQEVRDDADRLREQAEGLRAALKNIDSIASRGDVNVQPLLDPIRRVARETLARYRGGDDVLPD